MNLNGNLNVEIRADEGEGPDPEPETVLQAEESWEGIYPNPFTDRVRWVIRSEIAQSVTIEIHDVEGRKLSEDVWGLEPGENTYIWDGSEVPAGLYIIRMRYEEGEVMYRLIKQ
jgi:hypothetical protein